MNDKMRQFVRTYGGVGVGVHLAIAALSWAGFVVAINSGLVMDELPEWAAGAGVITTAWAAMKLISPIRWLATAAITPVLVTMLKRVYGRVPFGALGSEESLADEP